MNGLVFPFVLQLFEKLPSALERSCGGTYTPFLVVWPFTCTDPLELELDELLLKL